MHHIVPFELDIDKIELWESKFDENGISYSIIKEFNMKPEPDEDFELEQEEI